MSSSDWKLLGSIPVSQLPIVHCDEWTVLKASWKSLNWERSPCAVAVTKKNSNPRTCGTLRDWTFTIPDKKPVILMQEQVSMIFRNSFYK